jgi:hypothetical protein
MLKIRGVFFLKLIKKFKQPSILLALFAVCVVGIL